ncbi:late secretory pathway protein avl9 [Puccinia graminis f. sp. tritici]|uniref:Late secretory pathway protein avl9 n=1 Tax=Puccinia graminis f. sp. tritici TaxID=56615 RepID=A0A5B0RH97_PUCGR|nr:late secretory pathway protein avl9 [Puccinia graminis f. sp. tritici]
MNTLDTERAEYKEKSNAQIAAASLPKTAELAAGAEAKAAGDSNVNGEEKEGAKDHNSDHSAGNGRRVSVTDTRDPLADTRQCQRIPANRCGFGCVWPLFRKKVGGYPKGYPRPEGEMAGWKETLPADKYLVDWKLVTQRLEGSPSSCRGTSTSSCTSSTGRASFQPARYKYLVDRKGFLPAVEVQVP